MKGKMMDLDSKTVTSAIGDPKVTFAADAHRSRHYDAPLSLAPLDPETALRGLLNTPTPDDESH